MGGIYNNRPLIPIARPSNAGGVKNNQKVNESQGFGKVLEQIVSEQSLNKQEDVKFSKHALERLQSRNISLSKDDISKINNAVNKAAEKGIKETLIIMGNTALIANVKNKTVVTAAAGENLKDNVFTNIDGAVII